MFRDRLREIADRLEAEGSTGVVAVSLVAADGIPIETLMLRDDLDLELLAAELMSQVRAVSQNHRELSVGEVRHVAITTDRLTLMVTGVTDDYYLLLVLPADTHAGRARFELRRATLLFERDLHS